jgi:hypothetical protein
MTRDPVRLALIDTLSREDAIVMIVGALRSAHRMCEGHKFGGGSPNTLWCLINGIGPRRRA